MNKIEEFDFEILSRKRKEPKNGVPATVKPVHPAEGGGQLPVGSPSSGRSLKLTAWKVTDTGNAEWCDVSFSLSPRRARELHRWSPRP